MIIGIDLGTTNSLVSIWKDGASELVKNSLGQFMTPSVVGVSDDGHIICGQPAKERLYTHPHLTASVFKRFMGSQKTIQLGNKPFTPQELSSFVLKSLKADVEAYLGETVEEAIITVPAYFNDTQRKITKLAGELAGLKVERLINEPTSASLAYGIHQKDDVEILVIDLGGGTFDVSVLELFDGVMEVRASAGDSHLGGEDFSAVLMEHFISHIPDDRREQQVKDKVHHLIAEAERAKLALSEGEHYDMTMDLGDETLTVSVDRAGFEKLAAPLLKRIQDPIKQALQDSNIRPGDLDSVLLVGGATRMPMIAKLVTKMFGRFPDRSLDPDQVVALGASIQGALKRRDKALDEIVLTDICPYTLGIEVVTSLQDGGIQEGVFCPIIERNTTVPVSREDRFFTAHDQQSRINIRIYQGESRYTRDNILLGEIEVPVTPAAAGEKSVDVRFSYDINGLLEVDAAVVGEEQLHQLLIADDTHQLSEEDIAASREKLKALKIHPRNDTENIALLYRGNRLYSQHKGQVREEIGRLLDEFNNVLASQDLRKIQKVRKQIAEQLDHYEF